MALVSAGSTVAVVLPAGATMTFSGLGTHQTSPPGSNGAPSKQLITINSQPQTIGPLAVATTINLMAAANGPGVKYTFASSNSARDTNTADLVSVSRNLTQADNGLVIPVANGVTLTIVAGSLVNFSAIVLPQVSASMTLAFSGGATGNGSTTAITRTRANNAAGFSILTEAQDVYAIGGT